MFPHRMHFLNFWQSYTNLYRCLCISSPLRPSIIEPSILGIHSSFAEFKNNNNLAALFDSGSNGATHSRIDLPPRSPRSQDKVCEAAVCRCGTVGSAELWYRWERKQMSSALDHKCFLCRGALSSRSQLVRKNLSRAQVIHWVEKMEMSVWEGWAAGMCDGEYWRGRSCAEKELQK